MTTRHLTSMWKTYILTLFCFFVVAVIFIGSDSVIQEKGKINQGLAEELQSLTDKKNTLAAQKAALSAPQRVEAIAAEELGMVKATQEHILYYTPNAEASEAAEEEPDTR